MNNEEKILEILVQMQTNITDLKSGQAQMQADITDLKSEQAQMRADITELKSEQAQMRADIADLRTDVTTLKSEQAQMRADITELKTDVRALHNKMEKGFQATRSEIVDVVEAVSQKVERLENTIKSVEDVTAQNAFDVQLMKRRA